MTNCLYQEDAYLTRAKATVVSCTPYEGNLFAVILDQTIFYPEGGGQLSDRGTINEFVVKDVQRVGKEVVHILEQAFPVGTSVSLVVDREFRKEMRQQHTGEHLLAACFWKLYKAPMLSFRMKDTHSTVVVGMDRLDVQQLTKVMTLAHRYIHEARPIKHFTIPATQIDRYELRKDVSEKYAEEETLRILEILGVDASPCGGTHVRHLGELGVLFITDFRSCSKGYEVDFVSGVRAIFPYMKKFQMLHEVTRALGIREDELLATLRTKEEEIRALRMQNDVAFQEFMAEEVKQISPEAPLVLNFYEDLSPKQLRRLSEEAFLKYPQKTFVFFSSGSTDIHYVCRGPLQSPVNMQQLSSYIAQCVEGKGGGTDTVAQGKGERLLPPEELVERCVQFFTMRA